MGSDSVRVNPLQRDCARQRVGTIVFQHLECEDVARPDAGDSVYDGVGRPDDRGPRLTIYGTSEDEAIAFKPSTWLEEELLDGKLVSGCIRSVGRSFIIPQVLYGKYLWEEILLTNSPAICCRPT